MLYYGSPTGFLRAISIGKFGSQILLAFVLWLESENADAKQEGDKDVSIIVKPVNGDEDESHLLNLPLHVLGLVMEFSVGIEYLKFRSECKTCHLAAPLIPWNNGKASKKLQIVSLVFYNPFTSDMREPPQLRDSDIFSFSAPPTSPNCIVVGITIDEYHYHVCIHFVGGERSWRRILLDIHAVDYFSSLTLFGRDLYALRDDR
ncbi:hypothetical protein Tco_1121313 [Tanacetum coccineum]|uniref:F-box protein n=1 Tax=Tanacetum coccineum TaxID=301880 RepID=A0ABQ5IXD6_9ASTR